MKPSRAQIEAAAKVFANHGIYIAMPWECTLDDLESERYGALRDALEAALALVRKENAA